MYEKSVQTKKAYNLLVINKLITDSQLVLKYIVTPDSVGENEAHCNAV